MDVNLKTLTEETISMNLEEKGDGTYGVDCIQLNQERLH
jgi:hypothetical protein